MKQHIHNPSHPPKQRHPQRMPKPAHLHWFASKHPIHKLCILNENRQFAVAFSDHRAIVDVRRTDDRSAIVYDHEFAMHVDQFGNLRK